MNRQKLPPTFPLRLVLIVSLVICVCGMGTIILAILSVKHQTWGYNWGTGFWCGAVTLAAGVCGIVASHAKNTCTMKLFMIFAVFGGVISLIMLALSAGGLDKNSGMYNDTYEAKQMTLIVHAGCLGLSILQLILFILADGICIYYLLVEQGSTLFSLKTTPGNKPVPITHRKRSKISKSGSSSSANPYFQKPKHTHKTKKAKRKNTYQAEDIDELQTPLRDTVLTQSRLDSLLTESPLRGHNNRNSFITFGRSLVEEQASLIVHPDDDVFTLRIESRASNHDEGHYAQTMLFEAPLPIEEDEELPPYEAVDTSPYRVSVVPNSTNIPSGTNRRKKTSQRKGTDTVLTSNGLTRSGEMLENYSARPNIRNEIPRGRGESDTLPKRGGTAVTHNIILGDEPVYAVVQPRRSRSADLLSEETDVGTTDSQGVMLRDFAHSSDKISPRAQRTQSLRTQRPNRERRLERRQRALSMEMKHSNKEISPGREGQNILNRTSSIDSSNSGLFADNRVMPTKFSLRTPVMQVGKPHVASVLPVKSISSLPMFQPPPKPPRTHTVTAEDLKTSTDVNDVQDNTSLIYIDCVSTDRNISNNAESNTQGNGVKLSLKTGVMQDRSLQNENETAIASSTCVHDVDYVKQENREIQTQNTVSLHKNEELSQRLDSEMNVQDNPVIKCSSEVISISTCQNDIKPLDMTRKTSNGSSSNDLKIQDSMTIPASPILKQISDGPSGLKVDKNAIPIPKARTSIKATKSKQKEAGNEYAEVENKQALSDRISHDNNDKTSKTKQGQMTDHDFSILRVNLPPLKTLSIGSTSPSLKILNRKFPKKEQDVTEAESHEVTNTVVENVTIPISDTPAITLSRSQSVEYKGARPKTAPRTHSSMKIKPNLTDSSGSKLQRSNASLFARKAENRRNDQIQADLATRPKQVKKVQSAQKKIATQKLLSSSKLTENNANRPVISTRNISNNTTASARVQNVCSPSVTQSVVPSASGASGSSQGVLRLPQTQFSRHVSSTGAQSSVGNAVNNNVPVNLQHPGNQQNANTDNLLISKFL